MEFDEKVNQIADKIRELAANIKTEEATKTAFIMPFIGEVLGYDVFNPNEVIPEFTADVGLKKNEKVDYALVLDDKVQILIECKKIGSTLSLEKQANYIDTSHAQGHVSEYLLMAASGTFTWISTSLIAWTQSLSWFLICWT